MLKIIQSIENQPGPESRLFSNQFPSLHDSAPNDRTAVQVGPHRDDSWSGIPTPNPFVLAWCHWQILLCHNQPIMSAVVAQRRPATTSGAGELSGEAPHPAVSEFFEM